MNKTIAAAIALTVAGCATAPENISASYVSAVPYQGLSCDEIQTEAARVEQALTVASEQQRKARNRDTLGVIMLGMPVASISNSDQTVQVGQLKGQQQVLSQVAASRGC